MRKEEEEGRRNLCSGFSVGLFLKYALKHTVYRCTLEEEIKICFNYYANKHIFLYTNPKNNEMLAFFSVKKKEKKKRDGQFYH